MFAVLLPGFDQIAKASESAFKAKLNGSNRAVPLLSDNDFRFPMQPLHFILPQSHFFKIVIARFFAFFVILLSEHEHHHIGILFN